jgi:beta-lactamase regulating signal transducer with metallopeptidase domain
MTRFFAEQLANWGDTLAAVLAHSLWQGLLVSIAVLVVLRTVPARCIHVRYAATVGGLAAVVLASFVTWTVLRLPDERASSPSAGLAGLTAPTGRSDLPVAERQPLDTLDHGEASGTTASVAVSHSGDIDRADHGRPQSIWLVQRRHLTASIVACWLLGVCVMLARTTTVFVRSQRWLTGSGGIQGPNLSKLEELVAQLSERLRLRRVARLVVCDQVGVPAVLGVWWPVILIPPAMVTGISIEQWRIVLAHELAHVRRYDNLVNLVQMLIESVLFFNPAVWWISRQIRAEREASCDALAVEIAGQPVSVARTLIDVADSLRKGPSVAASAAMTALAEPRDTGSLTDRVRRLLRPNAAPRPRLTGVGLLLALLVVVAAGAALQQGTDLAVRKVADLMTPKERVDKLARLQGERAGVFVGPGSSAEAEEPGTDQGWAVARPRDTQRKVDVTVRVRTADGSPVPAGLRLFGCHRTGRSSRSEPFAQSDKAVPEYSATESYSPGQLLVAATAPGYAETVSEPVSLFLEDGDQELELVLSRPFTARLRMIDEKGDAVANARIRATAGFSFQRGGPGFFAQHEFTAGADGVVVIDRASGCEYQLEVRAEGYQHATQSVRLAPGETLDWEMSAARPTEVRVVDSAGKPVPGANLVICGCVSYQNSRWVGPIFGDPRQWRGDSWDVFGTTDDDGGTRLNELRDDHTYCFGVRAEGFGLRVLKDVASRGPEQVVTLGPPLQVTGQLTGALDRLLGRNKDGESVRSFWYENYIPNNAPMSVSPPHSTVDEEGRFELLDLVAGRVTLRIPGNTKVLDVQESLSDVKFHIPTDDDSSRSQAKTREVVLRLTGTEPGAPARGNVFANVHYHPEAFPSSVRPIIDNEVRLTAPVSAEIWIEPRDLVGYAFDRRGKVRVVAGKGPQVVELATRPAGAVHGHVLRPDGSAADNAYVRAIAVGLPNDGSDARLPESYGGNSATFFRSLPLGGRYRLVAREFDESAGYWAVSDEFTVKKSHPIAELDLRLRRGRTVAVRVLDRKGEPMAGVSVTPSWGFSAHHHLNGFADVTRRTDPDGIARFEDVAPDDVASAVGLTGTGQVLLPGGRFGWHGQLVELPDGGRVDYEIRQPERSPALAPAPAPSR